MDFQLERFDGSLAGRTLHRAEEVIDRAVRAPGEVQLLCSVCHKVVARDVPIHGILRRVFECARCGALSVVGRSTAGFSEIEA